MSRRAPNTAAGFDVNRPVVRRKAKAPTRASELTDDQVFMLAEFEARSPVGHPAERCLSLFGFEATADDREHIAWVISLHPEWGPRLELARVGWDEWIKQRRAS